MLLVRVYRRIAIGDFHAKSPEWEHQVLSFEGRLCGFLILWRALYARKSLTHSVAPLNDLGFGSAGCGVRAAEANFERRIFGEDHFVAARKEVGVHRRRSAVYTQGDGNWLRFRPQTN